MSEVKTFRIEGEIRKPEWRASFKREVRAMRVEDALEKLYKDIGSKHRVKRFQIRVSSIREVETEEVEDPIIRKLSEG